MPKIGEKFELVKKMVVAAFKNEGEHDKLIEKAEALQDVYEALDLLLYAEKVNVERLRRRIDKIYDDEDYEGEIDDGRSYVPPPVTE